MITEMLFSLTHCELAPKYVLSILDPSRFKLAPSPSKRGSTSPSPWKPTGRKATRHPHPKL